MASIPGLVHGTPVVVLLGPVGVGKSLLASALAGLPQKNDVFRVGDSAEAVTLEAKSYRSRWLGRSSEEEVVLLDPPGVGDGDQDAARLAQVVRTLREFGTVSLFLVVLNSEQPRIGSVLENLLRLMEECFGRRFWKHVVLVFTRYYTDPRSARRRGSKTRDMMREEFSALLGAQFPHAMEERVPAGEPFPSYFVDSEAVINDELPEAERKAAIQELERLSVFARASPVLSTRCGDEDSNAACSTSGASVDADQMFFQQGPETYPEMARGTWVEVHGLVDTPSLNGSHGIVVNFEASKGRYLVELTNGSRKFFNAKNIQASTLPAGSSTAPSAPKAPDRDGSATAASAPKPPDTSEVPILPVGSKMKIVGLTSATLLNGLGCMILAYAKDSSRYEVQLADGTSKLIRAVNLTELPANEKFIPSKGRVDTSTIVEGALVQRGEDWMWGDQDGGRRFFGHVRTWDEATCWATVQWNCGKTGTYRIGADGEYDLKYADANKFEAECAEAFRKGGAAVKAFHLQCTFAYHRGVEKAHIAYFDTREEVCMAVGGFKHGQRVHTGKGNGNQSVVIGVSALLMDRVKLFFHLDGARGAGIFEDGDSKKFRSLGRQKVHEASPRPAKTDNQELMRIAEAMSPSFFYLDGPQFWTNVTVEQFDIRDEICTKLGNGLKHGQVVQSASGQRSVVIGARILHGRPHMFFHVDGKPGAGTYDDEIAELGFTVVGERKVKEASENELDEPPPSPEVLKLASELQCTFNYPKGTNRSKPGLFDIRDEVCLAVGGFRHGQVVRDSDGEESVVIGVSKHDHLQLWFHAQGRTGAGTFSAYHLVRRELKVVGSRKVHEVSTSDPMYQERPESHFHKFFKEHMKDLDSHLAEMFGTSGNKGKTTGLPDDYEFDYTFRYLTKACDPEMFDIRDDVCQAIGGFKHGDVIRLPHGEKAVVIGVRPTDSRGLTSLWFHLDGHPGASIFEEQSLIRMASSKIGRRTVAEFQEPETPTFDIAFISGLQCNFSYPVGPRSSSKLRLMKFDIRDEVCMQVAGVKHGQRLRLLSKMEFVVIGVAMELGTPEMFFHLMRPRRTAGAGRLPNHKYMLPHAKCLGVEAVQEMSAEEFGAERKSSSQESSSEASEDADSHSEVSESASSSEAEKVSSSEAESDPCVFSQSQANGNDIPEEFTGTATTHAQASGTAQVFRLSHCNNQVKHVLLNHQDLLDCHRDVVDAGCEVTPGWANGAVLLVPLSQEQAQDAGLNLRAHHVVAYPGDRDRVLKALASLPCRQRPRFKPDPRSPNSQVNGGVEHEGARATSPEDGEGCPAATSTEDPLAASKILFENVEIWVEKTFITCATISDTSTVNESAPCGDSGSSQPVNPRIYTS